MQTNEDFRNWKSETVDSHCYKTKSRAEGAACQAKRDDFESPNAVKTVPRLNNEVSRRPNAVSDPNAFY